MEGDAEVPAAPVCICSQSKPQPCNRSPSSVTRRHRHGSRGGKERNRRSGRRQVAEDGLNREKVQTKSRRPSSRAKRGRGGRTEDCSGVETGSKMTKQKTTRGTRGEEMLTPPTLHVQDCRTAMLGPDLQPSQSAMETEPHLQLSQSEMEMGPDLQPSQSVMETGPDLQPSQSLIEKEAIEPPESLPPVKRWVIGPFFQSFKSKMASFTEIVMSPVRLFKPSCPLALSNTLPDLQNSCPDSANGSNCNSPNGRFSEENSGENLDTQRRLEAKSKNEDHTDSSLPQAEGQICGRGEVAETSADFHQPQTSSAQACSSSTEKAQLVIPSVRRLKFDIETKAGDIFDEEQSLQAEKQNYNATPHTHRLRRCDAFPSSKERLRESPCSGQCSQLPRTKLLLDLDPVGSLTNSDSSLPDSPRTRCRSSLHLSTSEGQRSGKGAHLQRSCTEGTTLSNICPNRPLKRSPSSDLFTHTSPKKAPLSSDEALGFCREKCFLGNVSEPPGLDSNTSGCSSTSSTSFYFTPPICLEAKPGDLSQLEAGEDSPYLTICRGNAAQEMHRSLKECGVPPLPSKTPVTMTDSPDQDSVQVLADNVVGTREVGGPPVKQNPVQIPPHFSLQVRPPLRGPHDQHGGGIIRSSVESQGEPLTYPERSSEMHERLKVKRGGKRGKGLKKKRNDGMKEKNELLIVTDGETREEVRSDQNSRVGIASQIPDRDLHRSLSSSRVVGKGSQDSCLTEVKGGGNRRKNLKAEHPPMTENALTVGGKCQDTMIGSSLGFKDCSTGNSSTEDSRTASSATSVNSRKLRSCVIALEDIRRSPNRSMYDSRVITETRSKEEDAAGIKESDTLLKDARPREHQRCRHWKRELSPAIDTDPMLNQKCLAIQQRIPGPINHISVASEMPKESERSQESELRSQKKLGRLRRRLKNHANAEKGIRKEEQQLFKMMTVDKELEREATPLGDERSPCALETPQVVSGGTGIEAGGNSSVQADCRSQVQSRMHTPINRKTGGNREKGKEGTMGNVLSSPPATNAKHKLPEADEEELQSGKVHRLMTEEVPQNRRGRKWKQRDGLRMPEDSPKRKSRCCFRATCEKKEDEGEQSKETGLFEKPGCDSLPTRLMRSYSCPEIPSLLHDCPWTSSPFLSTPRSERRPSPLRRCLPFPLPPSSAKRTRRHTVCSLEVEREIAPLCLRKEVHPTGWGGQYYNPISSVSSASFTALASRFLSSPLAFLSRRPEESSLSGSTSGSSTCTYDVTTSSSGATPSTSSPVSSLVCHLLPGTTSCALPRSSQSTTSVSSFCSVSPQVTSAVGTEGEVGEEEEDDEGACFTPEHEPIEPRDEKSLSDSEIKTGSTKQGERGKVSRIKIRKTPPKPATNLTPMGLPRPARLKKKEFSLEEIYTNKNFHKPAEGRLETIFEVPTSYCDGSMSLFGARRLKRLVKFPELGVARKPRKALSGKGASRKAGDGSTVGRTRRGQAPKAKGPSHALEDPDSLLCSKLDQLDAWVAFDRAAP